MHVRPIDYSSPDGLFLGIVRADHDSNLMKFETVYFAVVESCYKQASYILHIPVLCAAGATVCLNA